MGLYAFEVAILHDVCKAKAGPIKALSLGHPDILATKKELSFISKHFDTDNVEVHQARRNISHVPIIGNARPVFKAMGADLTVIDTRAHLYNVDYEVDLNFPVEKWQSAFDLVIDCGTTEHCFNVGQALKNVANFVAKDGFVYHMVPLCHWNHGFWNFSPGVFYDFYDDNGFIIHRLEAEYRGKFLPVNATTKFEIPNSGRRLNLMCLAERKEIKPITFPLQRKYRGR